MFLPLLKSKVGTTLFLSTRLRLDFNVITKHEVSPANNQPPPPANQFSRVRPLCSIYFISLGLSSPASVEVLAAFPE